MPPSMQPQAPSLSRHIAAALAVILVLTALVLVILQNVPFGRNHLIKSYADGYKEGFVRARELALQAGLLPTDEPHRRFSGIVTAVGGGTITFTAEGIVMDKAVDAAGTDRVAKVDASTVIVKRIPRPDEEVEADFTQFNRLIEQYDPESDQQTPESPLSYSEVTVSLADIAVDDRIVVVGQDGEDLTNLPAFTASKISVLPKPEPPSAHFPERAGRDTSGDDALEQPLPPEDNAVIERPTGGRKTEE